MKSPACCGQGWRWWGCEAVGSGSGWRWENLWGREFTGYEMNIGMLITNQMNMEMMPIHFLLVTCVPLVRILASLLDVDPIHFVKFKLV